MGCLKCKLLLGSKSIVEVLNRLGFALQAVMCLALGIPVVALFKYR
jgi:hypothetical protein